MLRFTIRDVLLVTMIVALAVGRWIDRRTQSAERREALAMMRSLERFLGQEGYKVTWTHDNDVLTILRPGGH